MTIQPARHECHACCLLLAGYLAFQPVVDNTRGTRVGQVVSSFQKILRGSQLTWYWELIILAILLKFTDSYCVVESMIHIVDDLVFHPSSPPFRFFQSFFINSVFHRDISLFSFNKNLVSKDNLS